MIDDSEIVKDIRKIRCPISERFDNDPERYIDYLILKAKERKTDIDLHPDEPAGTDQPKSSAHDSMTTPNGGL
jgi:hypothetical protein